MIRKTRMRSTSIWGSIKIGSMQSHCIPLPHEVGQPSRARGDRHRPRPPEQEGVGVSDARSRARPLGRRASSSKWIISCVRNNGELLHPSPKGNRNYTDRRTDYVPRGLHYVPEGCRRPEVEASRGDIMQPEGPIMGPEGGIISATPSSGAQ